MQFTMRALMVLCLLGWVSVAAVANQTDAPQPDTPPATEPATEPTADAAQPPADEPEVRPADPPEAPGEELVVRVPAFFANVAVNHADGRYRDGDLLTVRFKAERAAHVYLLYHQADGSCLMLFPNVAHTDNRLAAGQEVVIPEPGASFRFRVRPPLGNEALQVLAAAEPIEELTALDIGQQRAIPIEPEVYQRLAERVAGEPGQFAEHRVRIETMPAEFLPPAEPAKRVALFFGVNEYLDPDYCRPHEEYRRSVELFSHTMMELGGVAPEHCKVIFGKEATREGMRQAITQWLPSVSRPGDTVFIYYVGHGGQVKNLDGSEPDGYDEFLTVYDNVFPGGSDEDFDRWRRETQVLDDVLARWLQELPGRQIVLMLDTCHSGGAIDARRLVRSSFQNEAERLRDISQLNTLVVCGSGPDESVWFSTGDDNVTWMPFFFCAAMRELPAPVSVQQAFEVFRAGMVPILQKYEIPGLQQPELVDRILLPVYLIPPTTP